MRGFTLVELLVVFGIFIIVSVLSIPFVQSFQVRSDLRTATNDLMQTLRRAQLQSVDGVAGFGWGVYLDNAGKKFVLFNGATYAGRDAGYDLETAFPAAFSLSSDFGNEVAFAVFSGLPSVTGTTTMANNNNESKNINISALGLIKNND